jgi:photosynthetic reaction center H subunit
METGAITSYVDVAQIVLYLFWAFFAGLIYYLHREDKREGYPLESDRSGSVRVEGWPAVPTPKTFLLRDGRSVSVPNDTRSTRPINATASAPHLGAPLVPNGDPMLAEVGPGSYADRADIPDSAEDGQHRLAPLRIASDFKVASEDPDPRGRPVFGADGNVAGVARELWVDRAEVVFRYIEVTVPTATGDRNVLLPINFCQINERGTTVRAILAHQFAQVPVTRNPDSATLLEEDRIVAYYGAGTLYATPERQEPLL